MYALNIFRIIAPLGLILAIFAMTACTEDNFVNSDNTTSDNTGVNDTGVTSGVVSQANFSVWASDSQPKIFDATTGTVTYTEVTITARMGDKKDNPLAISQTVHFRAEWGLINENCVTVDGVCSVIWRTTSTGDAPADHLNTIVAYTAGEESFQDLNGNYIYDDNDGGFWDVSEPYVDSNWDGIHNTGEPIVDVPNGIDPTGTNGTHDAADGKYNGAECTHSTLCSTTTSIYVWSDLELDMNGPPATP